MSRAITFAVVSLDFPCPEDGPPTVTLECALTDEQWTLAVGDVLRMQLRLD